jgi:hypothetical protein
MPTAGGETASKPAACNEIEQVDSEEEQHAQVSSFDKQSAHYLQITEL